MSAQSNFCMGFITLKEFVVERLKELDEILPEDLTFDLQEEKEELDEYSAKYGLFM